MAIVSDVEIRLRADIARLRQDLQQARGEVTGALNQMGRAVDQFKSMLAGLGVGIGLGALIGQLVGAQREFDKLNAALITATGSTANAAKAMAALQDFASQTPYSLQEVTEGFLKLRNLGLTPSERALTSYGNTAAAMGKSLEQLIEAVADGATGEFERLKEFGIKSKQQGDQVAFTFQGTTTKVKNSASEIEKYLMQIGEVNFAGAMERQANTLNGDLSALADTWNRTLIAFNQSGFGDSARGGAKALSGALVDLQAIMKAVAGEATKEGDAVDELGPIHQGLTTFFEAITVLGVNVAYTFKAIGQSIGVFAGQAAILFNGGFAGLMDGSTLRMIREVGAAQTKQAEEDRRQVDATSASIVGAAARAAAARKADAESRKKNTADVLGEYKILDAASQDYLISLKNLQDSRARGSIGEAEYIAKVGELAKQTYAAQISAQNELSDAQKKAAETAAKAAKTAEDARLRTYQGLIDAAQAKVIETQREAEGLDKLTESQQMALALDRDLANGKVKLTAAEEGYYRMIIEAIGANEETVRVNKEIEESNKRAAEGAAGHAKLVKQLADEQQRAVDAATAEAETQERLTATFGLSEAALAQLEVARLEEQLAQRSSLGLTLDEIEHLERLIPLKQRAAAAIANREDLEKQRDLWNSIEKTAHDTFVSIIDGGKNAATRLKDTFKNIFFDWLYQQTLKKWIINLQGMATLDGSGAAGAVGSAAGSSLMGSIGTSMGLKGLLGVGGIGGSLAAGAGWLTGATTLGGSLTAGASLIGTGTLAGGIAGAGVLTGALAPVVLGIAGVAKILDKAFGRGPKTTTGQGITGTFGADAFSGSNYTEWMKKGGWFSSTKRGTDTSALTTEQSAALNSAYAAIKDSTSAFATALGVPVDVVTAYTKTIKLAYTGDAAKDQQLLADLFAQMGDELAARVLPNIAQFIAEGETAAAALQRLSGEFQGVQAIFDALGISTDKAFGAVGIASLKARDRLVQLSGGLDALASQTTYFAENFYTEAERMATLQTQVQAQLTALGYAGVQTADQFKAAVVELLDSGALATEQGAQTYATLLQLAPDFKTLSDYLAQTKAATEAAADAEKELAAEREQAVVDSLRSVASEAFSALQRSVDADRAAAQAAFETLMAGIEASIDKASAKVSELQSLASALAGANVAGVAEMRGAAQRNAGRAQIAAALAIAKASGVLPTADSLKDALSAVAYNAEDQYSTLADFQRDQLRTANDIAELGGLTETELTVAQRTLAALQDQKTAAQAAYDAQMAYFDEMLTKAQAQLDAINGVRTDVMSLPAAFQAFANTIAAALANRAIASQPSVTPTTQIESLYNSILGRTSDAAGLAYYLDLYNKGASLGNIAQDIKNSTEYQTRGLYTAQQSGTMTSDGAAIVAELKTMNTRIANVEAATSSTASSSGQTATLLDDVTAGGNRMAVGA